MAGEKISLWAFFFWICQVPFAKHLEIDYFSTCHIVLALGKQQELANQKYKTVRDALTHSICRPLLDDSI
jgi:hypothetical protein